MHACIGGSKSKPFICCGSKHNCEALNAFIGQ